MSPRVLGRIATLHMKRANALFSLCPSGLRAARASPRPESGPESGVRTRIDADADRHVRVLWATMTKYLTIVAGESVWASK